MASIVNNTYSCASGETINAGRTVTTPLAAFIAGMSAGSWGEYTGTNINEPLAGDDSPSGGPYSSLETVANYPLTIWANKWFYDPANKLIGGIGTAQGYVSESPAGTHGKCVWFDLVTNAFSQDWNPTGDNQGHIYDGNVSRPLNGYVYRRGFGATKIYRGNVAARTWELSSLSHSGVYGYDACGLEVFPDWGSQGSLLMLGTAAGTGYLYRWDLATGTRTSLGSYACGDYPIVAYVPAMHACVFGGGPASTGVLFKIDASGTISQITTTLPVRIESANGGPFLADPAGAELLWLVSAADNKIRSFNPASGAWVDKGAVIAGLSGDVGSAVGVSLTGLGALAFLHGRGRSSGVSTHKFWIYKV